MLFFNVPEKESSRLLTSKPDPSIPLQGGGFNAHLRLNQAKATGHGPVTDAHSVMPASGAGQKFARHREKEWIGQDPEDLENIGKTPRENHFEAP